MFIFAHGYNFLLTKLFLHEGAIESTSKKSKLTQRGTHSDAKPYNYAHLLVKGAEGKHKENSISIHREVKTKPYIRG